MIRQVEDLTDDMVRVIIDLALACDLGQALAIILPQSLRYFIFDL